MKRTFTQKVKKVPTCAADSFEALLKLYAGKHPVGATIPLDVNNRRARTSAAMIGLAISMGTTGLLLPRQGDEALAVEPIAVEPTLPNPTAAPESSVAPAQAADSERIVSTKPLAPVKPKTEEKPNRTSQPVVEHQVHKGETLWELSKTYEVKPEAISASNKIEPSRTLRVGQKLKIPAVNGIVHEVKPGDTVKSLSESYGVEPTQLRASAPLSESSQLKAGESVTVPGNVNNLLKARQDVALKNLKEQRNRLNESLAELRSEESTKQLTELAKAPTEATADTQSANSVTLPSAVLKSTEPLATPQPVATALASPVVIPVPTPEMFVSPALNPKAAGQQDPSVVIPVPTPEIAASPTVSPKAAGQQEPYVVIPVPTPEIAASPTVAPQAAGQQEPSVVIPRPTPEIAASPTVNPKAAEQQAPFVAIPVPTPEIAASPTVSPKAPVIPNITTAPVNNSATVANPQVPQPVVIEPIGTASASNIYKVKPGDTLDAIARRYGLSRSQLAQVNDLNNPNLLSINQPLRIPQPPTAGVANATVALLPSINPKSKPSALGQQQGGLTVPTLVVPTPVNQNTAAEPTGRQPQPQPVVSTRQAESITVEGAKPNSTVLADNKPSQSADSQQNLYVEKLKADILRLRSEYRQQRTGGQSSNSTNIAVPTVTTPVASNSNNASTPSIPIRVNPEFNPKRQNETLQADRGNQRLLQEPQSSIPIEVPPPETTALTSQQGLVASASSPTGTYNPALRTPVGQTVSPELPPLGAPDIYSPTSPTEFNGYIWPAKGVLTSGYGRRWGRMHKGIDIANAVGTPIVAAGPGVVVSAGWNSGGYGNLVEVQHPDGSVTLYAHNSRILVRRGQVVEQGQQISEMGSTGYSTGPHLHFEVHPPGRGAVNPIAYLPKRSRS